MPLTFIKKLVHRVSKKLIRHTQGPLTWDADGIAKSYNLSLNDASFIVDSNDSYQDFNQAISNMQNEFGISKDEAIKTLVRWAIEHETTKDIDDNVWRENNRLCGISNDDI
ncbi:MAG: hypothetical protein J6N72_07515 [Psychrobacter sp.]|nr:hypothetical protein [Psychrobacter sp.]